MIEFTPSLGYLGLFIISLIANVIPFIPIPYLVFLVIMSINSSFDPHLLAFISAIGASIGKLIIFLASYYGRNLLSDNKKRNLKPLEKVVSRYGWIAVFIAATTPIPDDLVYIPLGLARYNPLYFALSNFGGKLVISEAVVWGSRFGFDAYLKPFLETPVSSSILYILVVTLAIITGIIIYVMTKIDWSIYIKRFFPWTIDEDNK